MKSSYCLLLALWVAAPVAGAQSIASLNAEQKQVEQKKRQLDAELTEIQRDISRHESGERGVLQKLKKSEESISRINARLEELSRQKKKLESQRSDLRKQSAKQKKELDALHQALADQLYMQYTNHLSPWSALLSGQDVQKTGRELGYLGYISKDRSDSVKKYRLKIAQYHDTEAQLKKNQDAISELQNNTQQNKDELAKVHKQYQSDLADVRKALQNSRDRAKQLDQNQKQLDDLLTQIAGKVSARKEALRQAELQRQAQALKDAQEAQRRRSAQQKIAEEQQKLAAEKQARAEALQRSAEAIRQQAQADQEKNRQQLAQAQSQLSLAISPEQEELVKKRIQQMLDQDKKAQAQLRSAAAKSEEAEIEQAKARLAKEKSQEAADLARKAREDNQKAQSQAGSSGLHPGAPWPLRGQIQGRFATTRPDTGGVWRGILIQAQKGAAVKAVAGGNVVYAGWLNGFGNLLIIDHGNDYMSVYGYNESLLKSVGDQVRTGNVVARAGASGGQVEPALYFEIRKSAKPIDPLSILSR